MPKGKPKSISARFNAANAKLRQTIVVLGMHRSGTSAVAGVCNLLGVELGRTLMPPRFDNPLGFWEHDEIIGVHDQLLAALGSSWHDPRLLPDRWMLDEKIDPFRDKLVAILREEFPDTPLWGIKDPRLCRLLPLWLRIFHELDCQPHFLIVIRNPAEVAASLKVRDGFSAEKSHLLWLRHVVEAEQWSRPFPRVLVAYEGLLRDWKKTMVRAGRNLGIVWPNDPSRVAGEVAAFLQSTLRHHVESAQTITTTGPLLERMVTVYGSLQAAAEDNTDVLATTMDGAAKELSMLDRLFSPIRAEYDDQIGRLSGQASSLQAQISQRDGQITTLQSGFGERNDQVMRLSREAGALQAQVLERQRQIVMLQNAVEARVDQVTRLSSEVDTLQTRFEERDTQIAALLNSNSWRITRPLRTMRAAFRRLLGSGPLSGEAGTIPAQVLEPDTQTARQNLQSFRTDDLLYSIDSLKIKGRRFYCFGWLFHRDRKVSALHLVARAGGKNHIFNACYPTQREDVAKKHTFANAEACGFWVSGKLPTEHVSELLLQIEFEGGITQSIHIQPSKHQGKRLTTKVGGVRITPHRISLALKALLRGDVGLVVQKLRADVAENRKLRSLDLLEDVLPLLDEPAAMQASSFNAGSDSSGTRSPVLQAFLDAAELSRSSDQKFILIIDHNLGGGANLYRRRLIDDIRRRERPILLLYYDLPHLEYIVDYFGPTSETRFILSSLAGLLQLAEKIEFEEIFLNNVYSFEDPLAMVALLPVLKEASGATLTVAIHDSLSICPSFNLLDETGKFCGVPDLSRCRECLPNNKGEFSFLIDQKDIKPWREAWGRCLREATSILCFSEASVRLMRRAYPELDLTKFLVRPHKVDYLSNRKPVIDLEGNLNIGIVGTISVHKGANVVRDIADCIKKRGFPIKITVIGTINPLPACDLVTVTGPYRPEELADLIEKHGVNMFLFPSILSETFSYVTEELIQLEVPLAVFNRGAPAERVAKYAKGLILPEIDAEKTLDALIAFHARLLQEERMGRRSEEKEPSDKRAPLQQNRKSRRIHAFTSADINYLPKVRLLCESIKQHHPEFVLHLALADKAPEWLDVFQEPFDNVIGVESLDIPNKTSWIFGHTITELSTAIKPFVLRHLLNLKECEQVYYFDPDIVLFSRIDDLIDTLDTGSILLTPHLTKPDNTLEAIADNEICSLKHGIYNFGFFGVRNVDQGRAFADWWSERLYHFCQEGLDQGLFTDQKWIDFVPVFFEGVRTAKSSRFNVAPWNLATRKVEGNFGRGFTVDGNPLAFYHFTGFDSGAHKAMATKYAGGNRAVASLIRWYEECTARGRDEKIRNTPWAYSKFENGELITKAHRLIYRMRQDLQDAYPNPFEAKPGKKSYYDWFRWQAAVEHPDLVPTAQSKPDGKASRQASPRAAPGQPNTQAGGEPAGSVSDNGTTALRNGSLFWPRVRWHLRKTITDPRYGAILVHKTLQTLRQDGISGIRHRLGRP